MDNLLLLAGTGRNSGKTTLICAVIQKISAREPVVAVKITPHWHAQRTPGKILIDREDIYIVEETQPESSKDSARMLRAGAQKVLFVMAKDEQLEEAIPLLFDLIPPQTAVVCESGGLIRYVEPGLFLVLHRSDQTAPKANLAQLQALAHRWITFDGHKTDFDPETISYSSHTWKINPKN